MSFRLLWTTGLVSVALLLGTGCEHADPVGPGEDGLQPTLNSIQENIFSTSCALSGCHAGANPVLGLDLSAGEAHASLVDVASTERPDLSRVEPGAPDESYLVHKIEGRSSIEGQRMPAGRDPLSQEEIDVIREWIVQGAPAN